MMAYSALTTKREIFASSSYGSDASQNHTLTQRIRASLGDAPFCFEIVDSQGTCHAIGEGDPEFRLILNHPRALHLLACMDEGDIADAYMDGVFDIEGDMLKFMDVRSSLKDRHPVANIWRFAQRFLFGQIAINEKAIAHHYNLDADFYLSFLDRTRCYTQGIFDDDREPLHRAIERKFDYCIDACRLGRGSHVLEIGPGWGAFTEYATKRGIQFTGVTNSVESKKFMDELASRKGYSWTNVLEDFLEFDSDQKFDAIVLMGIMEHLPNYERVLSRFDRLLRSGGFVFIDASAARVKYEASSFIHRHIYEGNHSFFVLHDFLDAASKTPFYVHDICDDRHSYYLTFQQWAKNFEANRDAVTERFGDRNFRRFSLYLWGSAHSFLRDTLQCYRLTLEKPASPA